ncbi:MAG: aminotransferase class I/II-fold pyridoxal phosphate-dependent enzyme [Saprospiraceae bacterium]|nr:aminotransferase class I/II-fold pyridoxal phosphate-dependent enzyme [Saprospiraceae bacterium]
MKLPFKPYLNVSSKYKGGKGKSDVQSLVPGKKIYKLSSNENMLGSSPMAIQAIIEATNDLLYYPERTDRNIREALESFYQSEIPEDLFLCANSGMELLDMICRAFLNEGENGIACAPAFRAYKLFTKRTGAQLKNVPLKDGSYALDVEAILDSIDEKTKLIFLNSPNNPTGTIIPDEDIRKLLDGLPEGIVLVLDEVYFHFNTHSACSTAYTFVKEGFPVIGVNSFSKCFGLAGLRVGYLYSTPEIVHYLRGLQRPFQLSHLSMVGAIAALGDDAFIKKTVDLVNSEKPKIYEALEELAVQFWESEANFIMIKPDMPAEEFERAMLMEGIMVRPVENFGAPGCIRVSIGTEEANKAYIEALKKVING